MLLLMFVTIFKPTVRLRALFAICLASICLVLYSNKLLAETELLQPVADIQKTIEDHVRQQFPESIQVATTISKLDPRLRLAKCPQPLEVFSPPGARKLGPTTLGVRCFGTTPWQIFVSVEIKAFGPAVVSNHPLPRGTIIHVSDLKIERRDLSSAMHGYYSSFKEVEGMELRYSLASGFIIGPMSVKPLHLVKQGDLVTILAETKGLQIRVKGTAMSSGFRGQYIRIKNTGSNRVLEGEVVASKTVRVKL